MSEETKKTRSLKYQEPKEIENEEEIEEEETNRFPFKVIFTVILIIALILIYAFKIGPHQFKVKEYKVESTILPASFNGFKVVQMSDIYYGSSINKKQLDKIVKEINRLNPDVIIFTGNLIDKNIQATDEMKQEVIDSLKDLKASEAKFAVYGSNDEIESYNSIMESINFRILNNESTLLFLNSIEPIKITGFSTIESNPDYSLVNNQIDEIDTTNMFKIVLFNESNAIDMVKDYNPNLVLTGGTLGGKINIVKPLFLLETSRNYYEDYYNINNNDYYVSNGIGTTSVNVRINNTPSINFFRLYRTETE